MSDKLRVLRVRECPPFSVKRFVLWIESIAPYKVIPTVNSQNDFVPLCRGDQLTERIGISEPAMAIPTEIVVVNHRDVG